MPRLFPRFDAKAGSTIFSSSRVKIGDTSRLRPVRAARSRRLSFRRYAYNHGVLTFERIRGTNRVFFSFHYTPDNFRVSQVRVMRKRAASIRSSDVLRLVIGQIGVARVKKKQEREGSQGSWEIWRLHLGRVGSPKYRLQEMDNQNVQPNEWEKLVTEGDEAIKNWIDRQMKHMSCVIVLIGSYTADRRWINYEIEKGWADGKGVFGVYVHNLRDHNKSQSPKGLNPFDFIPLGGRRMSEVVQAYDPPCGESKEVYRFIRENMDSWIDMAIKIRRDN